MDVGFIQVHRKLVNSSFYNDSEAVHLWIHLLFKARFSDGKYWVKDEEIMLKAGQFVTGRKVLSAETKINESKIQRLMKRFEKCHMIEQQTNSVSRLITIVNYNEYQSSEQQVNNERTASEQQVNNERTLNNNVNNNNNENKEPIEPKFDPKKYANNIEWIDNDLWIEWIDHKKKVKASITERALKANVKKLEGFGKDKASFNIGKALEKNWKDFYIESNHLFCGGNGQQKHEQVGQVLRSEEPVKTATQIVDENGNTVF